MREYQVERIYRFFPLHPEIPERGVTLEELFGPGSKSRIEPIRKRLTELLRAEGLEYAASERVYNTRLAQELAAWADAEHVGGIHDALFSAYFVRGQNLGDRDVLVGIAAELGLPAEEARRVLETRAFSERVEADWREARELGITGVPTFVIEGRGVVGAQPYELLERLVTAAGVARRAPG